MLLCQLVKRINVSIIYDRLKTLSIDKEVRYLSIDREVSIFLISYFQAARVKLEKKINKMLIATSRYEFALHLSVSKCTMRDIRITNYLMSKVRGQSGCNPHPRVSWVFNACGIKLPTDTCYIFYFLFAKLLLKKDSRKIKKNSDFKLKKTFHGQQQQKCLLVL